MGRFPPQWGSSAGRQRGPKWGSDKPRWAKYLPANLSRRYPDQGCPSRWDSSPYGGPQDGTKPYFTIVSCQLAAMRKPILSQMGCGGQMGDVASRRDAPIWELTAGPLGPPSLVGIRNGCSLRRDSQGNRCPLIARFTVPLSPWGRAGRSGAIQRDPVQGLGNGQAALPIWSPAGDDIGAGTLKCLARGCHQPIWAADKDVSHMGPDGSQQAAKPATVHGRAYRCGPVP